MQNDALKKLIQWHLEYHKNVGIQDIYKMLYQGVFGAEHLLSNVERAKAYLRDEWDRVPSDKTILLLEPVSPDGTVVRANIVRCKAEGIDMEKLWRAFYYSVSKVQAEKNQFAEAWRAFVKLCQVENWPFDSGKAAHFGDEAHAKNWPAKHHTAAYRKANFPAYRVVLKREFERIAHIKLDEYDKF